MSKAHQYFVKRSNELDYPRAIELKLPLGSGSIESLIRQVVNLRLKSANKSLKNYNYETYNNHYSLARAINHS